MKNAIFVRFHLRRKVPERMAVVVVEWNKAFPTELTNQNREINIAVEARLRQMERALKIKRKYLDR